MPSPGWGFTGTFSLGGCPEKAPKVTTLEDGWAPCRCHPTSICARGCEQPRGAKATTCCGSSEPRTRSPAASWEACRHGEECVLGPQATSWPQSPRRPSPRGLPEPQSLSLPGPERLAFWTHQNVCAGPSSSQEGLRSVLDASPSVRAEPRGMQACILPGPSHTSQKTAPFPQLSPWASDTCFQGAPSPLLRQGS